MTRKTAVATNFDDYKYRKKITQNIRQQSLRDITFV